MEVNTLLCLFAQIHTPGACSIDGGGREVLREKPEKVPELKVVAAYGAYTEHALYYVVEADDHDPLRSSCPQASSDARPPSLSSANSSETSAKDWPVPHQDRGQFPFI